MMLKRMLLLTSVALSLSMTIAVAEEAQEKARSIFAEMENPVMMAQARHALDISVFCAPQSRQEKKEELYAALKAAKWDRHAMGCGLQYGRELLSSALFPGFQVEQTLQLLGDHIVYFDVLHKQYNAHYQGGDLSNELSWRWEKNRIEAQGLMDSVSMFEPLIPEVSILQSALRLASVQRESSSSDLITATNQSLMDLENIVASDAEALDGLPMLLLSQLLLSLPEFSGGDPIRAIEYLERLVVLSPNDLTAHRWLVEAYLSERETESALATLTAAASIHVASQHPQDYADLSKDLGGIAVRLGDMALADRFRTQRQALLQDHAYLLTRKAQASVGHGGADPITGEMTNEI